MDKPSARIFTVSALTKNVLHDAPDQLDNSHIIVANSSQLNSFLQHLAYHTAILDRESQRASPFSVIASLDQ